MTVQWLWTPHGDQLLTTRFMRNRTLFAALAHELLPRLRERAGRPLKVLVWACASGAEAYTLRAVCPRDLVGEVWGADIHADSIAEAQRGVYTAGCWQALLDPEQPLLRADEIEAMFVLEVGGDGDTRYRVRDELREGARFVVADLFAASSPLPKAAFDVVLCNNLLLHLQPPSVLRAVELLRAYVRAPGAMVLSGCRPDVRAHAAEQFALRPWLHAVDAIADGWNGVSSAWDLSPRPVWAWPPVPRSDPDYLRKRCEVFEVDAAVPADLGDPAPARGSRRRDEATFWLFDRAPRCLPLRTLEEIFADLVFRADAATVPALYQDNYYPVYEALARYLQPRRILEIGTRFGYSLVPLVLGALAQRPRHLQVLSIDMESYDNAFPCSSQEVARRNFEACIGPRCGDTEVEVDFVVGDSHAVQLPESWRFDLIHVDGDHSEQGAFLDIVDSFARLQPGGVMIVDDIDQPDVLAGYRRAVSHLRLDAADCAFVAHKHGLGVLRAPM
ncbi:MAG: CheR family methyltransferase [Planctomycetota bacterium]